MCGIIGYTGPQDVSPILIEGLTTLEYRGYDSAGIAVIDPSGEPRVHKASGKLSKLKKLLRRGMPEGNVGIGHTRWATHGGPTDDNAHPHTGSRNEVIVVHNGIVENYVDLKRELIERGCEFRSDTDTECIPNMIESFMMQDYSLEDAVRETAKRMRGANAVVAISRRDPNKIVAFRLGNAGGIVVGYGDDEMLVASDLSALIPHTRNVVYLAGGEVVCLTGADVAYSDLEGNVLEKQFQTVQYDALSAAKGEYKHFMLKEINEQPGAVIDVLRDRLSFDTSSIMLEDFPFTDEEVNAFERVVIIGMGTSMHAAMVARHWIESLVRIPTEVDNSSEFRYRDPVIDGKTLVVSISQSGETADTLAAMDEALQKGAKQITLCNYPGTQSTRTADGTILIRSGLEICVAATKTFVCSLTTLYLLALFLAKKRGKLSDTDAMNHMQELVHLPSMMEQLLTDNSQYQKLANKYFKRSDFLFLGRGINYPLAMEGAIKLKEISYIHAEGYPAGEMKHGPISLIDENMPVVAIVPQDDLYEKMVSNVNEVKARGGTVIAIATKGDTDIADKADHVIYVPEATKNLSPMLVALPLQLLSYFIAVRRGCDVDQPRNLAKSVTVE